MIEDSGFMRILLSDYLKKDPEIELVATAGNGKEGFEKVRLYQPDVVITDMVMPKYDGLYAIRQIMASTPTPILVLSSLDKTNPKIFDALNEGAVDFLDKPKADIQQTFEQGNYALGSLVKSLARLDRNTLLKRGHSEVTYDHTFTDELSFEIVAIGASTGGPGAIESILTRLPANFPLPVVIAQHMPERFLISFADRLNKLCPLEVRVPVTGEELLSNKVYIVPGHTNTKVVKRITDHRPCVTFTDRKYTEFNNPSVDCLMESVGQVYGKKSIGVILSGMGKDGTIGMQLIKKNGGMTIAQDEASSVVFGMPKNAIDEKAAERIVKLGDIPGFIVSCLDI